jgi:hypothetical protein
MLTMSRKKNTSAFWADVFIDLFGDLLDKEISIV